MKFLFCNVGWMNYYKGINGDSIKGGGSYNLKNIGHEVCNFQSAEDKVYGYVRPRNHRINLNRIIPKNKSDKIEGVTVIWTAGPASGGTVVVGWYLNAKIYSEEREIKKPSKIHIQNKIKNYYIEASANDAFLIPSSNRTFFIPRRVKGFMGQSNIWYADSNDCKSLLKKLETYISNYEYEKLPDLDDSTASGLEGKQYLISHLKRERNQKIVKQKKDMVMKEKGKLECEICGFNFGKTYGDHGDSFIEAHHKIPIHKNIGVRETKLEDLALVCSNCHRIIHRSKNDSITIEVMKEIVSNNK